MFCEGCGRNLADVERLPTRAEWVAAARSPADPQARPLEERDTRPLEERCAEATAAFLDAMRAAGNPGATMTPMTKRSALKRPGKAHGWVVRPVDREDFEGPRRYEPGLVLTVDGAYHRLDSEIRGWGQRDFPVYWHTVEAEPVPMPVEERLIGELDAVLDANGVKRAPAG